MNAESVYNLIEKLGIEASYKDWTSEVFDPATNETTRSGEVDYDVKAIPPYEVVDAYGNHRLIAEGKGMTGIANYSLSFVPKKSRELTIAGTIWVITSVQPLSNASGVLCYLFGVDSK
jgi:hypothetical protein